MSAIKFTLVGADVTGIITMFLYTVSAPLQLYAIIIGVNVRGVLPKLVNVTPLGLATVESTAELPSTSQINLASTPVVVLLKLIG